MKKRWLVPLFLLVQFHCAAQSPLWGNLQRGPHFVGFRTIGAYDLSRQPITGDSQYTTGGVVAPGRQVQISLWYPATAAGKPLLYVDYVQELSRELDFSPLTEAMRKEAVERLAKRYEEDYSESFKREQLDRFLPLAMMATRDAKPAEGKFPVLVFPQWFSPADGTIMSEYLASQGFVVATTSLKGTDSTLPEISPRGLRTVATDLAFVIQQVGQLPFADISKLALMGVGINATACATLMKDNTTVDAFISLEGGIITAGELAMFQQTGFVNPASMTMPMLFIHAPHPAVNPQLADYFKYADKYYMGFKGMSEFYFLNNGMIEKYAPGIFGQAPGQVTLGFEVAARSVAAFLRFTLKGDEGARITITSEQPGEPQGVESIERQVRLKLPVPPSLQGLKEIAIREGAGGIRASFDGLKDKDPRPFTQMVLADLFNWLAFGRDADYSRRTEVVKIWLEAYPESARGEFAWARMLTAQNNLTDARPHYERAVALLLLDRDIYLDNVVKERIRMISEGELRKGSGG